MPTPQELARTAEPYEEQDRLDFLDELDAVSRRRRRRPEEPAPSAGSGRDAIALWIARRHLAADSGVRPVVYLPKDAPADEVRFLEINDRPAFPEPEASTIRPLSFGLDIEGAPLRLLVADLSSEQFDALKAGRLSLPPGWDLDGCRITGRRP